MPRERSVELRVGLTVLVALVALVVGTAWLAGSGMHRRGYTVTVLFPEVDGLGKDDPVMVSGVERGHVRVVELRAREVAVEVWLPAEVKIPDDSRWSLESMGMMGERLVGVRPGRSASPVPAGAELRGEYRPSASEVAASAGGLIESVESLVARLDSLLVGSGEGALGQAGGAARDARELVAENRPDLRATVQDLREASAEAKQLLNDNRQPITRSVEGLARVTERMERVVERLDRSSRPLAEAADRIGRGEGSLGKFVEDDSLYFELRRTVRGLDSLLTEVREDPGRFFKVQIF